MKPGTKTTLVACALIVAALAWEAYALSSGERGAWTFSQLVWRAAFSTPLVPFLFGVLMGHFFFPKGSCVHCGLRPWGGKEDGSFDARLMIYEEVRRQLAGNTPRDAHLQAKYTAGFPMTDPWNVEQKPEPRGGHGMSGGDRC